jgi:DNA-directed RNA polymerase subunit RPC12/RpoP
VTGERSAVYVCRNCGARHQYDPLRRETEAHCQNPDCKSLQVMREKDIKKASAGK